MAHDVIPLTELGRQQAQALAGLLPSNPSRIFVSPYLRAQDTAQPYCDRIGLPAQSHALLHEFSTIDPVLLQGMNGGQRHPFVQGYWQESNPDLRMGENAETFVEFERRVRDFALELDQLTDGTVIFGHGMWMAMLIWRLLGFSATDSLGMKSFRSFQLGLPMPNGAVYRVQQSACGQWYAQASEVMMRNLMTTCMPPSA